MAYREKMAWITLTSMLVAYAVYFPLAAVEMREGAVSTARMLALFGAVAGAQGVVMLVAGALLSAQARRNAEGAADERDRAIARRGTSVAYYVLLVGMLLVGVVMPFEKSGWAITNAALLAIVVAEAVHHGLIALSYRRGWHG